MTDKTKVLLLELACVAIILGSFAIITVPKLGDLQRRETAAVVLYDIEQMRDAVFAFYSDSAYFPAESPADPIPEGLRAYLPGLTSRRTYGSIVYKNWPGTLPPTPTTDSLTGAPILTAPPGDTAAGATAAAQPQQPPGAGATSKSVTTPNIVGAIIIANDPKVVGTAAALSPLMPRFVIGNRYTFLFFGT